MLKVVMENGKGSIEVSKDLGVMSTELIVFMRRLRETVSEQDRNAFDHFLRSVFVDCVFAADNDEIARILMNDLIKGLAGVFEQCI